MCRLPLCLSCGAQSVQISAMWGRLTAAIARAGGGAWGGKWVCWQTKASGGVFAPPPLLPPPPPPSSHFVCHVIVLSCRQVAVGTDCVAVVLVTRGHEGQAVGVDLLAGGTVSISSFLLAFAKLPIAQSLQHLSAHLQSTHTNMDTHTHTHTHTHRISLSGRWRMCEPQTACV